MEQIPVYMKNWHVEGLKNNFAVYGDTGIRVCTVNNTFVGQQRIANLIAAAPALLAALEFLVERGTDSPQHLAAEQAIRFANTGKNL